MGIVQDRKGYLWIATNGGGVARFDGMKFTVFTTEDGLNDNRVNTVFLDKKGDIWLGTQNGISRYDGKNFTSYGEKEGLKAAKILAISEDQDGNFWIGTEKEGLYRYDGKVFSELVLPGDGAKRNEVIIHSILCDSKGAVWIGANMALYLYEKNGFTVYNTITSGICGNDVWTLYEDHNKNIWSGTWNCSVCSYDRKEFRSFGPGNGITNKLITSIFEDDEHNLWIGSDGGGIYRMNIDGTGDKKVSYHIHEANGLPSNRVRSIFQDREGNIWIGTDDGLSRFDRGMFTTYTTREGLNNKFVLSFLEDATGKIYFGTQSGISMLEGDSVSEYKPGGKSIDYYVWSMMKDEKSNFYTGTYMGGLYVSNNNSTINYSHRNGLSNDVIFDIKQDKDSNIWIGSDFGIGVLYNDTLYNFDDRDGMPNTRVRTVYPDSKGNVWFGTRSGMIKYTASGKAPVVQDFKKIFLGEKIDKGILFSIVEDPQGYLWFGNYGNGLVRFDPSENSTVTLTIKDGLSDNGVLSLVLDGKYLWVGTINGINRLDVEAFNLKGEKKFRHFGKAEGFSGVEVNQNAILRDSKGNIWFGTGSGAVKYDPHYDWENKVEPSTFITDICLFFENIDWMKYADSINTKSFLPENLILPYNQNHLTFYFSGICFTAPEKVRYRYMLEGLDKDWSPVTIESYASYPSIPPGEYTFLVKACNNEGIWNAEPVRFSFTMLPPVWKTIWFYSLCIFMGATGTVGFSMYRNRSLRKAKRVLELEVLNRTKELREKTITLEEQNKIIEEKNKSITDSIHYAKRIQQTLMPTEKQIEKTIDRLNKKSRKT